MGEKTDIAFRRYRRSLCCHETRLGVQRDIRAVDLRNGGAQAIEMNLKQHKHADTFTECYEVSLDFQKPDGYWVMNHKVPIEVLVKHGQNEKSNHDKAEAIAKQLYPHCKINSVSYC